MGVFQDIGLAIQANYTSLLSSLPSWAQQFINLFLLVLLVLIFSVFVWKFHKFISRKNIFNLNLNKYNTSKHPVISKFLAIILYFIEYIFILPIMIFFWLAIFSVFLILMADNIATKNLIIISSTVIVAIRFLSYMPGYGRNLAQEIAKLLPFNLMAFAMIKEDFFDFERILGQISEIPAFFSQITMYLLFVIGLEIVLRFFDFLLGLLGMKVEEETKEKDEED